MSDAYHTCYVLSGLSAAQHQWRLTISEENTAPRDAAGVWTVFPYPEDTQIFGPQDRIQPTHPVYAIPLDKQLAARDYFLAKEGF